MSRGKKRRSLARVVGWGLVAAAVSQELRKPAGERTWHGRVAAFVPYDFRVPTIERIRSSWWNPNDERIFTDQVFGVGWAVNLGRIARLTQS
ncbi:hypothetical protein BH24ACT26_BH24ACT26_15470 [soil metagenome]